MFLADALKSLVNLGISVLIKRFLLKKSATRSRCNYLKQVILRWNWTAWTLETRNFFPVSAWMARLSAAEFRSVVFTLMVALHQTDQLISNSCNHLAQVMLTVPAQRTVLLSAILQTLELLMPFSHPKFVTTSYTRWMRLSVSFSSIVTLR